MLGVKTIAAALVAALLFGAGWTARGKVDGSTLAKERELYAELVRRATAAHAAQAAKFRERERALVETTDGIVREAKALVEQANSAARTADHVAGRMRDAATRAARLCSGPAADSAPGQGSGAAPSAGDLLADVLGRLEEAGRGVSRHADESWIASSACAAQYRAAESLNQDSRSKN